MSTTSDPLDRTAEAMDLCQVAADCSPGGMLANAPREITYQVTPEFYAALVQLSRDTRQDLGEVFTKAIALYKTAVEFKREGKHVGAADEAENLETEFVGLGHAGSGL